MCPFNLRYSPYATGGLWTTTFGGVGWNIGGGFKIKLNEDLAVRAEFKHWTNLDFDWGVNLISFGITLFF